MPPRTPLLGLALCGVALLAAPPDALAAGPSPVRGAPGPRQVEPPAHAHTWVKKSRKEWVPPVKKTVQVGTDAKGNPIFETRIVKPGYWKTVTFLGCSCGAVRG